MKEQFKVFVNGKAVLVKSGALISDILDIEKLCGGHGRCGKCKVKAKGVLSELTEAELKLLSADELESGVRLACLTYALGDCKIETLDATKGDRIVTGGALPDFEIAPTFEKYGVAIDIGTTTIAARLYDRTGGLLAESACLNPQKEWGADVISRIEAALDGKATELANAIRKLLDSVIEELSQTANVNSKDIDGVVITGNTVMLSLLVEESVEPFSHAPFDVKRLFGEVSSAGTIDLLNLNPDTAVYFPPCISAFVGADTVCAILASELCRDDTAILADIGTNGEIAMWHNSKLSVCSTAAGPAFEGVGISMGMRGATGAIDKVSIVNQRLFSHVIGEGSPVGICGSGLVDAVACMLKLDMLDESGYFEEERLVVEEPVSLSPKDIRMVQLAKSAICAGILTLIENVGLKASDVSALYIAGGFGSYLNKASASAIGLIPKALSDKIEAVGNAALSGATILLLDKKAKIYADALAREATTVELAANPVFAEKYMNSMFLEEI